MQRIALAVVIATLLPLVAEAQHSGGGTDVYRIVPGDQLRISVRKSDAMSVSVVVRPDGQIALPLLDDVRAAGLTAAELRDVLRAQLGQFIPNPEVVVTVSDVGSAYAGSIKRIPF